MKNHLLLPKSSWPVLADMLLKVRIREECPASDTDLLFLRQLGYLDDSSALTKAGLNLCELIHVRKDSSTANELVHIDVQGLPVTQLLLQSLSGLKDITVDQARMCLLFAGIEGTEVDSSLTNFLTMLNATGVVAYNRKNRSIRLLVSPKQSCAPAHIYIDRTRPYSNDLWIREILRECEGSIAWLDKYFKKEAFEWIWREATADKVSNIRIVSTSDEAGVEALAIADYKRLKKELAAKGIALEWRILERGKAHDFHDRWILDETRLCYNVPSINSIKSGQRSELHRSSNHTEISDIFEGYFASAKPV